MKKIIILLMAVFVFCLVPAKVFAADNTIEVLPTLTTQSDAENRIWVGTFQIVWNEMFDNIIKGPIKFVGLESPVADSLNQKEFTKDNIDKSAYYTKYGKVSLKLKKEIEKGIRKKFHEKSDILDMFDFSNQPNKIFLYAMLKKDFRFLNSFDKLSQGYFGDTNKTVEYFGINDRSNARLHNNLCVLFYNSNDDFAVKLYTKGKDEVILYRTDMNTTFDKYFAEIDKKSKEYKGNRDFVKQDVLMIPNINLYQMVSFKDVEGYEIEKTNFIIEKTLETVDFRMNNAGVKLKSEAAIMVKCMCLPHDNGRYFRFNDNFVLFLVEKGQNVPYYAMRVHDVDVLNKTAKNK